MTDRWRLLDNGKLHDIKNDSAQRKNLINEHPEVAAKLRADYDRWWETIRNSKSTSP